MTYAKRKPTAEVVANKNNKQNFVVAYASCWNVCAYICLPVYLKYLSDIDIRNNAQLLMIIMKAMIMIINTVGQINDFVNIYIHYTHTYYVFMAACLIQQLSVPRRMSNLKLAELWHTPFLLAAIAATFTNMNTTTSINSLNDSDDVANDDARVLMMMIQENFQGQFMWRCNFSTSRCLQHKCWTFIAHAFCC